MTSLPLLARGRGPSLSAVALLLALGRPAPAQPALPDLSRAPLLPPEVLYSSGPAPAPTSAPNRIRLYGIQPGFLSELPWLDKDDRPPDDPRVPDPEPDAGPEWLTITVGNDNPYFELRQPGDPGGVGYARVNTQVQIFDTMRTACALGLQAVTPLGVQFDGLPDNQGATVLTPALALFHATEDGTGVQAFVGKNMPVMNAAGRPLYRDLQCGLGVHRPFSTDGADPLSSFYVSVGALGRVQREKEGDRELFWQVLPGLHWKPAETWWLSAGYVLPVGPARTDQGGHWRLTCSWQF
jgi:hypothetical protein